MSRVGLEPLTSGLQTITSSSPFLPPLNPPFFFMFYKIFPSGFPGSFTFCNRLILKVTIFFFEDVDR